MNEIILILIVNSLYIVGFKFSTEKGNILEPITYVLNEKWIISKPIYSCVQCMASIHSLPFFIYYGFEWYTFPFYVAALSAINLFTYSIIDKISSK